MVSAGCIFAVLTAGGALNLTGVVPFAPAIQIRDIDGLNTVNWLVVSVATFLLIAVGVYLVGFVAVAAADLQHRRLAETHVRLERAHGLIRRYVPEQVAEAILSDAPEAIERHDRRKLTIFFSDLVDMRVEKLARNLDNLVAVLDQFRQTNDKKTMLRQTTEGCED